MLWRSPAVGLDGKRHRLRFPKYIEKEKKETAPPACLSTMNLCLRVRYVVVVVASSVSDKNPVGIDETRD